MIVHASVLVIVANVFGRIKIKGTRGKNPFAILPSLNFLYFIENSIIAKNTKIHVSLPGGPTYKHFMAHRFSISTAIRS
jgi:hypothetical protein